MAAAALLIGGVVIVGRGHGSSTSTATTTTVPPPTTAATTPATTTTSLFVGQVAAGPALGQPTGLVVYLTAPRQDHEVLFALDLDQGLLREVATTAHTPNEHPILGDAIVTPGARTEQLVHPEGATKALGTATTSSFGAGRADAYWEVSYTRDRSPSHAGLVLVGGPVERGVTIPAGFEVFAGDGIGGLLARGPDDRTYRLPPDSGTLVALDVNTPLAVANGRVAAVACDARPSCAVEIVDLTNGDRHVVPGSGPSSSGTSLSPDGTHLAQVVATDDANQPALIVIDTTSGDSLLHVPYLGVSFDSGPPRWSPDGAFLFWNDLNGLEWWRVTRIQPRTVRLPTTDSVSMSVVGVAAKT